MFMGFPVFNLIMGIIAGYYFGIKITSKRISLAQSETIMKRVSLFAGMIMLLICISTGTIALRERTLGSELQNMLSLGSEVTRNMIIAVVFIGGTALVVTQYYLTKITMTIMIKKYQPKI